MADDRHHGRIRRALGRGIERLGDRAVGARAEHLARELARVREIAASALDDIPRLRRQLLTARASEEYEAAFADPEPLVSVRIPTHTRSRLLVERALPSITRQTYQHFEVIVVGDGCTNDTAERIDAFGDPRVRFVNMPFRFPYPDDPEQRWLVAGAPGVNLGTELSRGSWLAMLGDDDELEPDHLECLLREARASRSEMVFGKYRQRHPPPTEDLVYGCCPPVYGQFNFQSAIFMRALRFFEFNVKSWVLDEPADWNLCRRMIEAGVRIGYVDRVVVTWYASRFFEEPDAESSAPDRSR